MVVNMICTVSIAALTKSIIIMTDTQKNNNYRARAIYHKNISILQSCCYVIKSKSIDNSSSVFCMINRVQIAVFIGINYLHKLIKTK